MVSLSSVAIDAFLTEDRRFGRATLNLLRFEPDGGAPAREHNFA
jgi:hypothetical protein